MLLKPQPSGFTLIEQPFIRGKRLRGAHAPGGQNAPMNDARREVFQERRRRDRMG
jgi:hypothetical protein